MTVAASEDRRPQASSGSAPRSRRRIACTTRARRSALKVVEYRRLRLDQ
jgi:hypothetical protein